MPNDDAVDILTGVALAGAAAAAIGIGVGLLKRDRHDAPRSLPIAPMASPPSVQPTPAQPQPAPRAREAAAMTSTAKTNYNALYTPAFWGIVLVGRAAGAGIPLPFLLNGIAEESGGNPCAIGRPDQYGPDGQPREVGIWQFYNPDDLQFLKVPGAALRAYCNPNKVKYTLHDGNGKPYQVDGPSQELVRYLTVEELSQQADMTVAKVSRDKQLAQIALATVGATWPSTGDHAIDFWRAVKLVHGLPGILTSGLPAFKAKTGHAPASWREWRHAIESGEVHCDPNTERYRVKFGSIFDNAERAASGIPGTPLA